VGQPGAREAHRALAREVTTIVHGRTACDDAVKASEIMFGGGLDGITESLFSDVAGEIPTTSLDKSRLEGAGLPLVDLLVLSGLCPSKGQARKDIEGGGIYLNNVRVAEAGPHGRLLVGPALRPVPPPPQGQAKLFPPQGRAGRPS
jgi:tyrosyl-tRNA synthetase